MTRASANRRLSCFAHLRIAVGAFFACFLIGMASELFADVTDGLVAWYKMDGNANDSITNKNNGANNGAAATTDRFARASSALNFDGTYIALTNRPLTGINTSFSISAWFSATNTTAGYRYIFRHRALPEIFVVWSSFPPNGLWFEITDTSTNHHDVVADSLPINQWIHCVATYDGSVQKLYTNGVLASSNSWPGTINWDTGFDSPCTYYYNTDGIGGDPCKGDGLFRGSIDEVRFYNRALSASEINSLYTLELSSIAGTVFYGPLQVGSIRVVASGSYSNYSVNIPSPQPYAISNVGPGSFSVTAFHDTNGNGSKEIWEAQGAYPSNPIFHTNNVSGIDITLTNPFAYASITGTVSYAGQQTGVIRVAVCTNSTTWNPAYSTVLTTTGQYSFASLPTAVNYWIKVFRDANGNGSNESSEAYGSYVGNPIYLTHDLSAVDVSLTDQDTDGDGMPDWWETQYGLITWVNDANDDRDLDGLTNMQEYQHFQQAYDPNQADSLSDGKSDYERLYGKKADTFYYDKLDRLVGAEYNHGSNGLSIAYRYDGNGNLTNQVYLQRNQSGDGVPDLWKFLHGLSVSNANAYADSDGDGWTNFQEWKAGSDPSDPNSIPNLLGTSGTNVLTYSVSFAASNFVMAAGQLDGVGAEEIVIGADGNPGTVTNQLLILTQSSQSTWSTQTVAIGKVGITSIAIGQVSNSPSPAIYIGTRNAGGTGTVMEVKLGTNGWITTSLSIGNTSQVAYVLGVRPSNDILVSLSPTNAPDQSLHSLTLSNSLWFVGGTAINSSHRTLGSTAPSTFGASGDTSLRLLDNGGIQLCLGVSVPTNAVYNLTTANWYFLTPSTMTWLNAQAYAQQFRGGNLTTIDNAPENTWIRSQFPTQALWIGLYRLPGSSLSTGWQWISGSATNYFNWKGGEPNDAGGPNNELWVQIIAGLNTWGDDHYSTLLKGVVEINSAIDTVIITEPSATQTNNWRGHSLSSGFMRQTNGVSVCYAFVDDKNTNSLVDAADDFVVTEYLVNGTSYTTNTSSRLAVQGLGLAQSYGLACANILNSSNDVFFTGEPDGSVYSWTLPPASNQLSTLSRSLFDGHYAGKAWHQLGRHRGLETGDALTGLLVDPSTPNQVSLIRWLPRTELPQQPDIRETAPQTQIMPTPNSGGALSIVNIRVWDAEGNASTPLLQYSTSGGSFWSNATLQTLDGSPYTPTLFVTAHPTGTTHSVVWNAGQDLGSSFSNSVLLQARSRDFMKTGSWSPVVSYFIQGCTDCDNDGLPDAWEIQYFGSTNAPNGCASCDPDGDGFSNLQEYLAGTIPTNSGSSLGITAIAAESNDLRVTWIMGSGRTNALQAVDGSITNSYADIFTVTNTVGNVTNYLDPGAATNAPARFYRVRLVP